MDKHKAKQVRLQRRKFSIRQAAVGTPERPRLSIFRSEQAHLRPGHRRPYAGKTLASVSSTVADDVRGELKNGGNIAAAKRVGKAIAERAKAAGVKGGL